MRLKLHILQTLDCKCAKIRTFSNLKQKFKTYILPIILHLIPVKFKTLKPPTIYRGKSRELPPPPHLLSSSVSAFTYWKQVFLLITVLFKGYHSQR